MNPSAGARPWLMPFVPLYRLGLALHELALATGLERRRKLRWPVVSVGNLTTGGAGKTPLTITLARALTRRGLQVDVLSRGYGRSSAGAARVNPEGTVEQFGDEPILIARETGVPVYVAARRYEAGLLAEQDALARAAGLNRSLDGMNATSSPLVPEDAHLVIHLLDDGFQHRQLHRDLNILLLDAATWFNERLLPAGNLREPLHAMRRADILAIPAEEAPVLEKSLREKAGWQGSIWRLRRTMDVPAMEAPGGASVVAFCGIARPAQFFEGLRGAGLRLAECIAFPDHHRYTARDLDRLGEAARRARAAAFVTTEKDRVRLGGLGAPVFDACPLKTARLQVEIEDEDAAMEWLLGRLSLRPPQPRT